MSSLIVKFNNVCFRAAPSRIYQGKSKLCGSPSGRLQCFASTKINYASYSHLNFVTFSFRYLPRYCNRKISPINIVCTRNFRTKHDSARKRGAFGHKQNNFNDDEDATFSKYFFKLSSATFVSIFGLL